MSREELSNNSCRFFGRQDGDKSNKLLFEPAVQDVFGLPQATFQYKPTDTYAKAAHDMMNESV